MKTDSTQDAFYVLDAHKHLLIRIRDELTREIEKMICLQLALMPKGDKEYMDKMDGG